MKQILQKAGLCILIFIVLSGEAIAQTEKGDWLVGGLLQLNTAKNSSSFEFSPNAGYFLFNNFAFGAKIVTAYEQLGDLNITSFGVGPFIRYYFTESKIKPFFAGDFDVQNQKFKTNLGSETENAFNYFLGGGTAFFINDNVAVEALLGFRHTKVKDKEGNGGLNFRVGFQVYINRHQAQSVKSSLSK